MVNLVMYMSNDSTEGSHNGKEPGGGIPHKKPEFNADFKHQFNWWKSQGKSYFRKPGMDLRYDIKNGFFTNFQLWISNLISIF